MSWQKYLYTFGFLYIQYFLYQSHLELVFVIHFTGLLLKCEALYLMGNLRLKIITRSEWITLVFLETLHKKIQLPQRWLKSQTLQIILSGQIAEAEKLTAASTVFLTVKEKKIPQRLAFRRVKYQWCVVCSLQNFIKLEFSSTLSRTRLWPQRNNLFQTVQGFPPISSGDVLSF